MTEKECAIVMAFTGISMLTGEKLDKFYKYIEEIMGRPVFTHELASDKVFNEIKDKSKADFLKLCETATDDSYKWHDLQKDKNDLPEPNTGNRLLCIQEWRSGEKDYVFAEYEYVYGYDPGFYGSNGHVIAWKEIEPFEVEE